MAPSPHDRFRLSTVVESWTELGKHLEVKAKEAGLGEIPDLWPPSHPPLVATASGPTTHPAKPPPAATAGGSRSQAAHEHGPAQHTRPSAAPTPARSAPMQPSQRGHAPSAAPSQPPAQHARPSAAPTPAPSAPVQLSQRGHAPSAAASTLSARPSKASAAPAVIVKEEVPDTSLSRGQLKRRIASLQKTGGLTSSEQQWLSSLKSLNNSHKRTCNRDASL